MAGAYGDRKTPNAAPNRSDDVDRLGLRHVGLLRPHEQFVRDRLSFRAVHIDMPFDLDRSSCKQEGERLVTSIPAACAFS